MLVVLAAISCVLANPVKKENSIEERAHDMVQKMMSNDATREKLVNFFKGSKDEATLELKKRQLKDVLRNTLKDVQAKKDQQTKAKDMASKMWADEGIRAHLQQMFKDAGNDPVQKQKVTQKLKDMVKKALHSMDEKKKKDEAQHIEAQEIANKILQNDAAHEKIAAMMKAAKDDPEKMKQVEGKLKDMIKKAMTNVEQKDEAAHEKAKDMATKMLANDAIHAKIAEMFKDVANDPEKMKEKRQLLKDMVKKALIAAHKSDKKKDEMHAEANAIKTKIMSDPALHEKIVTMFQDAANDPVKMAEQKQKLQDMIKKSIEVSAENKKKDEAAHAKAHALAKRVLENSAVHDKIVEMLEIIKNDPANREDIELKLKDMLHKAMSVSKDNEKKDDVLHQQAKDMAHSILANDAIHAKITEMLKDAGKSPEALSEKKALLRDMVKKAMSHAVAKKKKDHSEAQGIAQKLLANDEFHTEITNLMKDETLTPELRKESMKDAVKNALAAAEEKKVNDEKMHEKAHAIEQKIMANDAIRSKITKMLKDSSNDPEKRIEVEMKLKDMVKKAMKISKDAKESNEAMEKKMDEEVDEKVPEENNDVEVKEMEVDDEVDDEENMINDLLNNQM